MPLLHRIRFTAYLRKIFLIVAIFSHILTSAFAGPGVIVANPDGQLKVIAAQNDVPIVNIVAPNNNGLSHNRYQQYNVNSNGLILNNSQTMGNSTLGGVILGNPNLRNGTARIILNEVVGSNRSHLRGTQEIFGTRADLIIANPYGITCNGCGFINTSNAELVTGIPYLNSSRELLGYRGLNSSINIMNLGLNGSSLGFLNLISKKVQVDGEIHAGHELNIKTGNDFYNRETGEVRSINTRNSSTVSSSIDSSSLGGMYGGRINLVSSENGTGVNIASSIVSYADNIEITSNGNVSILNVSSDNNDKIISANKDLIITGNIIDLQNSTLQSSQDFQLDSNDISIIGSSLTAANNGEIKTKSTTTRNNFIKNSQITFGGTGIIELSNKKLYLNDSSIVAGTDLSLHTADMDIIRSSIHSNGVLSTVSNDVLVSAGSSISSSNEGNHYFKNLDLYGNIRSTNSLALHSRGDIYNAGTIEANDLNISANNLTNVVDRDIIAGNGGLTISLRNKLDNRGSIETDAEDSYIGALYTIENRGKIYSNKNLSISSRLGLLSNSGILRSNNDLTIEVEKLYNSSTINTQDNATVTINATDEIKNTGTIYSYDIIMNANNLVFNGRDEFSKNEDPAIIADNNLNINVRGNDGKVINTEVMLAGQNIEIKVTKLLANIAGEIIAGRNLRITPYYNFVDNDLTILNISTAKESSEDTDTTNDTATESSEDADTSNDTANDVAAENIPETAYTQEKIDEMFEEFAIVEYVEYARDNTTAIIKNYNGTMFLKVKDLKNIAVLPNIDNLANETEYEEGYVFYTSNSQDEEIEETEHEDETVSEDETVNEQSLSSGRAENRPREGYTFDKTRSKSALNSIIAKLEVTGGAGDFVNSFGISLELLRDLENFENLLAQAEFNVNLARTYMNIEDILSELRSIFTYIGEEALVRENFDSDDTYAEYISERNDIIEKDRYDLKQEIIRKVEQLSSLLDHGENIAEYKRDQSESELPITEETDDEVHNGHGISAVLTTDNILRFQDGTEVDLSENDSAEYDPYRMYNFDEDDRPEYNGEIREIRKECGTNSDFELGEACSGTVTIRHYDSFDPSDIPSAAEIVSENDIIIDITGDLVNQISLISAADHLRVIGNETANIENISLSAITSIKGSLYDYKKGKSCGTGALWENKSDDDACFRRKKDILARFNFKDIVESTYDRQIEDVLANSIMEGMNSVDLININSLGIKTADEDGILKIVPFENEVEEFQLAIEEEIENSVDDTSDESSEDSNDESSDESNDETSEDSNDETSEETTTPVEKYRTTKYKNGEVDFMGGISNSRAPSLGGVSIVIPTRPGLIRKAPPESNYIIETDPRFTSMEATYGSEYIMEQLGRVNGKYLGDPGYEQRLIKQQLRKMKGKVSNGIYDNFNDQYKNLMDAALAFSENNSIIMGHPLSPEEMELLTEDVVWLVKIRIDGQLAYAPRVYLANDTKVATGSTISSGGNLTIDAINEVYNDGNIVAANDTSINSKKGNINNRGSISSTNGNMVINASEGKLTNIGGDIKSAGNLSIDVKELNSKSVVSSECSIDSGENCADRILSRSEIYAGKGLTINSSDSVNVKGAIINSAENVKIDSNEINVVNQKITKSETDVEGNLDGGIEYTEINLGMEELVNTGIYAGNNMSLNAIEDINIKSAALVSGNDMSMIGDSINVGIMKTEAFIDMLYLKEKNSSVKTLEDYTRMDETISSEIVNSSLINAGNNMSMAANNEVEITSSIVNADGTLSVDAEDIILNADTAETEKNSKLKIKKTSLSLEFSAKDWSMTGSLNSTSTTTTTEVYEKKYSASSLLGGNVFLNSRNTITSKGANIYADEYVMLDAVGEIKTEELDDIKDTKTKTVTSSFSMSMSTDAGRLKDAVVGLAGFGATARDFDKDSKEELEAEAEEVDNKDKVSGETEKTEITDSQVEVRKRNKGLDYAKGILTSLISGGGMPGLGSLAQLTPRVEIKIGGSREVTKIEEKIVKAKTGMIKGGNVLIRSQDSNVTLKGTNVVSDGNIGISGKKIEILAADESYSYSSKTKKTGAEVGVNASVGAGLNTSQSYGSSKSNEEIESKTYIDSVISAQGDIQIESTGIGKIKSNALNEDELSTEHEPSIRMLGVNIASAEGNVKLKGHTISMEAAKNEYTSKTSTSGFTISIDPEKLMQQPTTLELLGANYKDKGYEELNGKAGPERSEESFGNDYNNGKSEKDITNAAETFTMFDRSTEIFGLNSESNKTETIEHSVSSISAGQNIIIETISDISYEGTIFEAGDNIIEDIGGNLIEKEIHDVHSVETNKSSVSIAAGGQSRTITPRFDNSTPLLAEMNTTPGEIDFIDLKAPSGPRTALEGYKQASRWLNFSASNFAINNPNGEFDTSAEAVGLFTEVGISTGTGIYREISGKSDSISKDLEKSAADVKPTIDVAVSTERQYSKTMTAKVTSRKAGGSISINANSINLIGSQFDAGVDVLMNARTGNLNFLAARNITETENEKTMAGGTLEAKLQTWGADAKVAVQETNGSVYSEDAVVGNINAGGDVSLSSTRGDINLHGTNIGNDDSKTPENIYINAMRGDINFEAAVDIYESESEFNSTTATARFELYGGAGGGAARNEKNESENYRIETGSNISAKSNIVVSAGNISNSEERGNITSVGTNFTTTENSDNAGIFINARNEINILAATSTYEDTLKERGGGGSADVSFNQNSGKKGDASGVGGSFYGIHHDKEGDYTYKDIGIINSASNVSLVSETGGITLEGTSVTANNNLHLLAKKDIDIKAAYEESDTKEFKVFVGANAAVYSNSGTDKQNTNEKGLEVGGTVEYIDIEEKSRTGIASVLSSKNGNIAINSDEGDIISEGTHMSALKDIELYAENGTFSEKAIVNTLQRDEVTFSTGFAFKADHSSRNDEYYNKRDQDDTRVDDDDIYTKSDSFDYAYANLNVGYEKTNNTNRVGGSITANNLTLKTKDASFEGTDMDVKNNLDFKITDGNLKMFAAKSTYSSKKVSFNFYGDFENSSGSESRTTEKSDDGTYKDKKTAGTKDGEDDPMKWGFLTTGASDLKYEGTVYDHSLINAKNVTINVNNGGDDKGGDFELIGAKINAVQADINIDGNMKIESLVDIEKGYRRGFGASMSGGGKPRLNNSVRTSARDKVKQTADSKIKKLKDNIKRTKEKIVEKNNAMVSANVKREKMMKDDYDEAFTDGRYKRAKSEALLDHNIRTAKKKRDYDDALDNYEEKKETFKNLEIEYKEKKEIRQNTLFSLNKREDNLNKTKNEYEIAKRNYKNKKLESEKVKNKKVKYDVALTNYELQKKKVKTASIKHNEEKEKYEKALNTLNERKSQLDKTKDDFDKAKEFNSNSDKDIKDLNNKRRKYASALSNYRLQEEKVNSLKVKEEGYKMMLSELDKRKKKLDETNNEYNIAKNEFDKSDEIKDIEKDLSNKLSTYNNAIREYQDQQNKVRNLTEEERLAKEKYEKASSDFDHAELMKEKLKDEYKDIKKINDTKTDNFKKEYQEKIFNKIENDYNTNNRYTIAGTSSGRTDDYNRRLEKINSINDEIEDIKSEKSELENEIIENNQNLIDEKASKRAAMSNYDTNSGISKPATGAQYALTVLGAATSSPSLGTNWDSSSIDTDMISEISGIVTSGELNINVGKTTDLDKSVIGSESGNMHLKTKKIKVSEDFEGYKKEENNSGNAGLGMSASSTLDESAGEETRGGGASSTYHSSVGAGVSYNNEKTTTSQHVKTTIGQGNIEVDGVKLNNDELNSYTNSNVNRDVNDANTVIEETTGGETTKGIMKSSGDSVDRIRNEGQNINPKP